MDNKLLTGPAVSPAAAVGTGPGARECTHVRVHHRHGTHAAYVADRCRCAACRQANRAAEAARVRRAAYGQDSLVDASPVRAHVQALREARVGLDQIAAVSGLSSGTLRRLVYGAPRSGRPVRRVRAATAAAITSVGPHHRAGGALVEAGPTQGLLDQLLTVRALPEIAHALGRAPSAVRATLARDRVTVATAAAVAVLARQILPSSTGADLDLEVDASRSEGVGKNAWECDQEAQDVDMVAVERAMRGEHVPLTRAEQIEAVRRLSAQQVSVREIARRLGTSPRTISRRRLNAVA